MKDKEIIKEKGCVYAVEWGADKIKIGKSKDPYQRIKSLKNTAKYGEIELGNFYISKPHNNYDENERLLHKYFKKERIEGTELFNVSLDEFKQAIDILEFDQSDIVVEEPEFLKLLRNQISKGLNIMKGPNMNNNKNQEKLYTTEEIAKKYGMSEDEFAVLLINLGVLNQDGTLAEKYRGLGYTVEF